jgi:hypothetical protein
MPNNSENSANAFWRNRLIQKALNHLVERWRRFVRRQKFLENRDAKFEHQVDRHHAEQRDAAQNIDSGKPIGLGQRFGRAQAVVRFDGRAHA